MDTIRIRDENGVSRRINSGKLSRIFARTTFAGKMVDPLPPVVIYEADVRYPNSIRID